MGGRDRERKHVDRNAWIREVSDERLARYGRMLESEGRWNRADGAGRELRSQEHLGWLIADEWTRRGLPGEAPVGDATRHRQEDLRRAWGRLEPKPPK